MAIKEGLLISRPISAISIYDRIVDNGINLIKVQIKGSLKSRSGATRFNFTNNKRKGYLKDDVDIFALYSGVDNCWYIVRNDGKIKTIDLKTNSSHYERWDMFYEKDTSSI